MPFWCQFLDPHLTTYCSNLVVQTIVVSEFRVSTLHEKISNPVVATLPLAASKSLLVL